MPDFETFSEAGYNREGGKLARLAGCTGYGLGEVGLGVYAEHPTTEALMLAYDLNDGHGPRLWMQGMPPPVELFLYLASGGVFEAWNVAFEAEIWHNVCVAKLGWPPLRPEQLRCTMARAQAYGLPGGLGAAAAVLGVTDQKDKDGDRLIKKFSCPRSPTKGNPAGRTRLADDYPDAELFALYNLQDERAERAVGAVIPELPPEELKFWQLTHAMNTRGVAIDVAAAAACDTVVQEAQRRACAELAHITQGLVTTPSEVAATLRWLAAQGVVTPNLDEDACDTLLAMPTLPPDARRVIETRQEAGSAGVKKAAAMLRRVNSAGRLTHSFKYHGARTGRDTGEGVQPQNLVKRGAKLKECSACGQYCGDLQLCPHCQHDLQGVDATPWHYGATDAVLASVTKGYAEAKRVWGNPVRAVSGCIRGLFVAGPGMELVCSDFSSIEAVVTAALAGEQWRLDAFHRGEDIYLHSAGKITGKGFDWYAANGGKKHPDRQAIGKPAELGLGFGGWIGAWRQFDDSDRFTDNEVKDLIVQWREASPAIVEFWGGQCRGKPWAPDSYERYGLEGAIIKSIENPGQWFRVGAVAYITDAQRDVLQCRLPSGRFITYHRPRLHRSQRWDGQLAVTYEGWNTDRNRGQYGWAVRDLYGGSACENVVQGVARDIMRDAVIRLEPAGYAMVLRAHDELVAEVPEGTGDVAEFERLMCVLPPWAEGWPVRAAGGYIAKRYRKD